MKTKAVSTEGNKLAKLLQRLALGGKVDGEEESKLLENMASTFDRRLEPNQCPYCQLIRIMKKLQRQADKRD